MESFFWFTSIDLLDEAVGYEDYIPKLYMHRIARVGGKSETLMELMDRYSNTECSHIRDRVFALYSMAADCQDPGSTIVDYSIGIPALFFTLLAHFKPSDVLGFAMILQSVLNVRTVQLQEDWNNVSTEANEPIVHGVEALAVAYIRQMKIYGKSLSSGDCIPSTPDFIVRSYIANFAPEALGKSDRYVRIDKSRFYLRMKHTLLGLRLREVCESKIELGRSERGLVDIFDLPFTMSEVWKYMIMPTILLPTKERHLYKPEPLEPVKSEVIKYHGVDVVNPSH